MHSTAFPARVGFTRKDASSVKTSLAQLKRILVPVDFSEASETALPFAVALARQFGAKIGLVHVIDLLPGAITECDGRMQFDEVVIRQAAKEHLDTIARVTLPAQVLGRISVRWGRAWKEITRAARELDVDLIVLTTQGLSGFGHLMLGSTAERVVRHACCPVLVVREPARHGAPAEFSVESQTSKPRKVRIMKSLATTPAPAARAPGWGEAESVTKQTATATDVIELVPQRVHLNNILVPTDFSAISQKALDYARPFAEQFGAKLTLVHIVDLGRRPVDHYLYDLDRADYNAEAQQKLDAVIADRLPNYQAEPVKTIVGCGVPWSGICDTAKDTEADLIILTTHGYTGLKHVFLGSTAEHVVRHAPCPVLVVREKASAPAQAELGFR